MNVNLVFLCYITYIDCLFEISALPEKYQHIVTEINSKRAASNDHGYCCTNWQYINKDEVVTRMQSALVPKTHTITVGYEDCHGNKNPTRIYIDISYLE